MKILDKKRHLFFKSKAIYYSRKFLTNYSKKTKKQKHFIHSLIGILQNYYYYYFKKNVFFN